MTNNKQKPPLGLMPHSVFLLRRLEEIFQAIERYYEASMQIPIEWIDRVDSFFDNFCDYYGDNFYILPDVTRLAIDEIKENYNKYAHKAMIDSKLCECDED